MISEEVYPAKKYIYNITVTEVNSRAYFLYVLIVDFRFIKLAEVRVTKVDADTLPDLAAVVVACGTEHNVIHNCGTCINYSQGQRKSSTTDRVFICGR